MKLLFIGGLSAETNQDHISDYFKFFGKILTVEVKFDPITGLSKGYGFISCDNELTYQRILRFKHHKINGREIDCNVACKKSKAHSMVKDLSLRKLFIGGLSSSTTNESLKLKFETYGEVKKSYLITDPKTGRSRNFGFVEFTKVGPVEEILNIMPLFLNGSKISCSKYQPDRSSPEHTLLTSLNLKNQHQHLKKNPQKMRIYSQDVQHNNNTPCQKLSEDLFHFTRNNHVYYSEIQQAQKLSLKLLHPPTKDLFQKRAPLIILSSKLLCPINLLNLDKLQQHQTQNLRFNPSKH